MVRFPALGTLVLVTLAALTLGGCSDDDPTAPCQCTRTWQEVALPLVAGESAVSSVDFSGPYGMALALVVPPGGSLSDPVHQFFRLQPDSSWVTDGSIDLRAGMVARDIALDTTGRPVIAGHQIPGPPSVVCDLRGAAPVYMEQNTFGMLTVDGAGAFMAAGGRASGGGLWSSSGPGAWTFDDLPLTGTNDSGFRDVDIRGDRAVACGYDDGADTLQVILTRTAATGWEKIPVGTPATATLTCIALSEEGTIFVGGIEGAGGPYAQAFLSQRTDDGEWTRLLLPDPELLHGVEDILIAADGSIYLACMGEGENTQANLVHADPSGVRKEITPFPGGLMQVAQAADGRIFAVGIRRDEADGSEEGVMLVRSF